MADNGQIDNVYVNFEVKDNGADDKISKFDEALEKLIATLERIDDKLTGFKDNFKGIETAIGNIKMPEIDTSEIDKAEEKIKEFGKIKPIPKRTFDTGFEQTSDSIDKSIKKASVFQRIIGGISKVFSAIGKIGSKAFEKIGKSTKKAHNASRGYQKGLRGLLGTAKRFLIFGTFFTIQRQVSQAFSEGTQNLYQYSKAIDGKFAQSMDRLATSFLYLKNAIGAAVAPIINAVTPALESLIDTVAEFGNKLAETFAALSGAKTFKKAIKYHKEYAEAVNNTNNALAKFDEINNITTSKSKDELDYGSLFVVEDVAISSWIGDIIQNIRSGNWRGVGSIVATKLNEQIQKLDDIDIGKKIGGKINQALSFSIGFVKTFDFGKFATMLSSEITDFINEIDWYDVGELFSTLIVGVFDFADEVVDFLSTGQLQRTLSKALTDVIDGISWYDIFYKMTQFMLNLINKISAWSAVPSNWVELRNSILKALIEAFKGAFVGLGDWLIKDGWKQVLKNLVTSSPAYLIFKTMGNLLGFDTFANGGYPTSGEMFIARENGIPEMVGSIGGRTAVANNDQIVEAISIGVYNAYMDAMSRSGSNKQPTIVQINGREVFRAVQDESTAYSRRTGQPAF